MLEGARQSRMEAETRAMQLDSYVGLLTDGIGMEDKSSEELESLESMFLQGLQRVVEARHLQTINDQRDSYEQKLAEMKSMYESKIEKLKAEHTECQDSFQKEKASPQDSLSALNRIFIKRERKEIAAETEATKKEFDTELKKVKTNSLKTEIALDRSREIRNELKVARKQNFRDVSNKMSWEAQRVALQQLRRRYFLKAKQHK